MSILPEPEPDDDETTVAARVGLVRLYDQIAPTYGTALDLLDVFGRDLVVAADISRGERVLDIGCGRGACLRPALEAVGQDGYVLGIDMSPAMVALLGQELQHEGITNARALLGDAERLDLADEPFDAMTCGFVVHHFLNLTATLKRCRQLLRPGGRLASSTFADGTLDFPWVLEVLEETVLHAPIRDRSATIMLTAPELAQAMTAAGFGSVVTTTQERRFVFADVRAYMTWVRAQGLGTFINRLKPPELQRFEDGCERRLAFHRSRDGYELLKSVDLTVAAE